MASTYCDNCPYWSVSHYGCSIYKLCTLPNHYDYIITTPPPFYVTTPCFLPIVIGHCLNPMCLKNITVVSGILIVFNMALLRNGPHIIYYHMDALWSMGLVWSYFFTSYLVVQCWVYALVLLPDSGTPQGPDVFHFIKVFLGWWVICMRVHHGHHRYCTSFCYYYFFLSLGCQ